MWISWTVGIASRDIITKRWIALSGLWYWSLRIEKCWQIQSSSLQRMLIHGKQFSEYPCSIYPFWLGEAIWVEEVFKCLSTDWFGHGKEPSSLGTKNTEEPYADWLGLINRLLIKYISCSLRASNSAELWRYNEPVGGVALGLKGIVRSHLQWMGQLRQVLKENVK